MTTTTRSGFRQQGYSVVRAAVSEDDCREFETALAPVLEGAGADNAKLSAHGIRNLLSLSDAIRTHVSNGTLPELAAEALGAPARPVKAIYFDKLPEANWVVPWHQDLSIAVREQAEVPGFVNWATKAGVLHVQPPASVLEAVVTLRIHLDDCPASNGAVRVVSGSHRLGRLKPERIQALRQERGEVVCEARRGDVLVMSPLILHGSPRAEVPGHRRIVHVEYSSRELPEPLAWYDA